MITIEDRNKVLEYLISKDKHFFEVEFDYLYDQKGVRFHHADMIIDRMDRMKLLKKAGYIGGCTVFLHDEIYDFHRFGGFK